MHRGGRQMMTWGARKDDINTEFNHSETLIDTLASLTPKQLQQEFETLKDSDQAVKFKNFAMIFHPDSVISEVQDSEVRAKIIYIYGMMYRVHTLLLNNVLEFHTNVSKLETLPLIDINETRLKAIEDFKNSKENIARMLVEALNEQFSGHKIILNTLNPSD